MNGKRTILICCTILLAGAGITGLIFSTEPTANRGGATKQTAMLVDVVTANRDSFYPNIMVMGTVKPSQDVILSPRVEGKIINRAPSFTPGGYVHKGETLLQIDSSDYRNALMQQKSALHQALADLKIEEGRQYVARQDYELLDDTLSDENKALVLREPQLNAAKSTVESAHAAVEQAKLELKRTAVKAPFDAHVLSRNADVGSQVTPGDNLGRLVGLEAYWVEATVPLSKLRWLDFTKAGQSRGSEVKIKDQTAWEEGTYRTGYLYKMIGALEDQTRMARVLVTVPDPLGYQSNNSDTPALMIGAFVEVHIRGKQLKDVIRLNRDYIRKENTVWIMEKGKLRIRDVDIVLKDAQYAYIADGLQQQDQIVTTNLSTVAEGARLRLEKTDSTASGDTLSNEI